MPPAWVVASDIADRIAELRRRLGESQEVFAKRFGREWKQVSQWENGRQAPRLKTLERAAGLNGWSYEMFAEGGPRPAEIPLTSLNRPAAPRSPGEPSPGPGTTEADLARVSAKLAFLLDQIATYRRLGAVADDQTLQEWERRAKGDG